MESYIVGYKRDPANWDHELPKQSEPYYAESAEEAQSKFKEDEGTCFILYVRNISTGQNELESLSYRPVSGPG